MAPSTLSQSIAQALASDIVAGRLTSGCRLDEISIAKRFKVSRTPVRDALRHLVSTRLIEYFPRRGFAVAQVDRETLKDIYEGLSEIEALCAGLCALRARSTERGALDLVHTKAQAAAAANDPKAYAAANDEFHAAIYAGAHNATLKSIAIEVRQRLAPFRSNRFFQRDQIKSSLHEHETIIAAILARDAERAASAMRLHTTRTAINVLNLLTAETDSREVAVAPRIGPRKPRGGRAARKRGRLPLTATAI